MYSADNTEDLPVDMPERIEYSLLMRRQWIRERRESIDRPPLEFDEDAVGAESH